MESLEYKKLVNRLTPKPNKIKNYLYSFLIGGLVGTLGEIIRCILVNYYNIKNTDACSIILFIFIISACFMTSFCDFDKYVVKYKAGLFVPITGFAHSITSSLMDYKKDGLIAGLGANFFKLAGSVILYGMVSAFLFTILKVVFYG